MITKGNTVVVHYTGKLKTGEVFDSSIGKDPISFKVGTMQVIPGFEDAVTGKTVGEKVTVDIPVDQAYGPVNESLIQKVPYSQMPGPVEVGQTLQATTPQGPINFLVRELNDDHVLVDANHPLAGEPLTFDIEVMEVN